MADWFDDELDPEGRDEGVRIVGAEEVGTAPDLPAPRRRRRGRTAGDADAEASEPSSSSWSASDEGLVPAPGEYDAPSGLPHWSEPATGEIPRSLGGEPAGTADEDLESWSALGSPRFRSDANDWAEGDFAQGELKDESTALGALAEPDVDDLGAAVEPPRRGRSRGRLRERRAPEWEAEPAVDERSAGYEPGALEGPPPRPRFDTPRRDSGVDLPQRMVTGVALAVLALVCFVIGRVGAVVLATAVVGLAAFELYESFRRAGYQVATVLGLLGCAAMVPMAYDQGERAFPMMLFLVAVFTGLWYMTEVVRARPTVNIALTMFGFVYVGCLGAFAGLLLGISGDGTGYLGGVIIVAAGADIFGYFVGTAVGNTPLVPRISPSKTLEGLFASTVAALVLGLVVGVVLHPWADSVGHGLLLGLVVAVVAPIGDLFASMLKRDLGIKDFGTTLPGHGGLLDRFDAILFSLPAAYYVALHLL